MPPGSGLKRLYYKAFAEASRLPNLNLEKTMQTEFAALVAIDWGDQKHA